MFETLLAGFNSAMFGVLVAVLVGLNVVGGVFAWWERIPVGTGAYEGIGWLVTGAYAGVAYLLGATLVTGVAAYVAVMVVTLAVALTIR